MPPESSESPELPELSAAPLPEPALRAQLDGAFAELYEELCVIARSRLRRQGSAELTGTGALVHECWLRLQRAGRLQLGERGRFLALAASVMRSAIVDRVRHARAQVRGGGAEHVTLDTGVSGGIGQEAPDVLAVDEALQGLQALDARAASVVEMRYFAGLSDEQIGQALGVSDRTVRRDWERARAYLALALRA